MHARSALVTGGTTGLGLAIAHRLVRMGLGVTVTGRDRSKLTSAVAELEGAGASVLGTVADAADWEDTERVVADHVERHGGLDVAIANAGFTTAGDLVDGDPLHWRSMVLTNVLGPALLIKAAVPHLPAPGGQIILVGSVAGRVGRTGSLYGVTKHAVAALGENARLQLTASGIRVALVEPGVVDTPFWDITGMPPAALGTEAIAATVAWIVEQPHQVDVNEVVVRPTGQLT
ncbi:MAG: SDR family NAD(P)-dependent oxidoreductase [Actinomycetota bacterium]|jgi:NADP-dependent 3-hydroxy acid dehydrogenase YdfG|nr:SDR family NAD(P)-dependent oxidoreductase [Actinomycetota bacterium]